MKVRILAAVLLTLLVGLGASACWQVDPEIDDTSQALVDADVEQFWACVAEGLNEPDANDFGHCVACWNAYHCAQQHGGDCDGIPEGGDLVCGELGGGPGNGGGNGGGGNCECSDYTPECCDGGPGGGGGGGPGRIINGGPSEEVCAGFLKREQRLPPGCLGFGECKIGGCYIESIEREQGNGR